MLNPIGIRVKKNSDILRVCSGKYWRYPCPGFQHSFNISMSADREHRFKDFSSCRCDSIEKTQHVTWCLPVTSYQYSMFNHLLDRYLIACSIRASDRARSSPCKLIRGRRTRSLPR